MRRKPPRAPAQAQGAGPAGGQQGTEMTSSSGPRWSWAFGIIRETARVSAARSLGSICKDTRGSPSRAGELGAARMTCGCHLSMGSLLGRLPVPQPQTGPVACKWPKQHRSSWAEDPAALGPINLTLQPGRCLKEVPTSRQRLSLPRTLLVGSSRVLGPGRPFSWLLGGRVCPQPGFAPVPAHVPGGARVWPLLRAERGAC